MGSRRKLFFSKEPYNLEQTNDLFAHAMRDNCRFHYNNCKEYKEILDHFAFSPEDVKATSSGTKG